MKVVLLQNIMGLGHAGEIKLVNDGYATNYLLPQQKAAIATPANINKIQIRHQSLEQKQDEYGHFFNVLNNQTISFVRKVSAKDHLFAAVTANDVVALILEKYKLTINSKWLRNMVAYKELGEHPAQIYLPDQKIINIKILISKET